MEALEWSECSETLDDLLKNPRVQLPQLLKLSSSFKDINSNESLQKDQIIVIRSKETIETIHGVDADGKTIIIPIDCPFKTRRKVSPGKEKVFDSVTELAQSDPLPRFVEVKEAHDVQNLSNGDRLKVVIVEKAAGAPSVLHCRSSSGKHVKISVNENISFQSSVSDGSDQSIAKLSEKSREFPFCVEFLKQKETPDIHTKLGIFTIQECKSETVVIASATVNSKEIAIVFPLHSEFSFQVTSKLKMAKDEAYRELCNNSSSIDPEKIVEFINHKSPKDTQMQYVLPLKKLQKILDFDYSPDTDQPSPKEKQKSNDKPKSARKEKKESPKIEKENKSRKDKPTKQLPSLTQNDSAVELEESDNEIEEEPLPPNTLVADSEQKEILKREIKERERQIKLEKEQMKAEKKREKKLKKEREKEEKKKKKLSTSSLSSTTSAPGSPVDIAVESEDIYIVPQDEVDAASPESPRTEEEQQSQFAMYLMGKVKKVRDRTTSMGFRPKNKKRGKLRKEDIEYISGEHLGPIIPQDESYYSGLGNDEAFSDSLYEALPGEMAYESLDLVAQAQRSLTLPVQTENSGDSGFDEIDQARIKAWRDSMAPPPLPGNHPLQNHSAHEEENLYETAVDCKKAVQQGQSMAAWQNFYDSVHQSTNEIATWDMEDVASCLSDLLLTNYIEVFSDSQVDGQLLLDLDESVLKDLGLSPFEARKLRKFVFGWRPDTVRPPTYPQRLGFDSKDPTQWNEGDVVKHLQTIDLNDFANFCQSNQVNGELLKDLCVDDVLMGTIITTKDKKLKAVKIKNYVIDQWRPKKKGEGNYMSSQSILPPEKRSLSTANINKVGNNSPKVTIASQVSASTTNINKVSSGASPKARNSPPSKKITTGGDAPLIARMKQQLEDNKNNWKEKK
ncbi:sterile alpha motif domain-containing protein 15-like [Clytia hemisphaerica]|uniref:SAM domain-containing protein n=1 Tax=Clytia hemisphaerica TaxID=252671 RepID=A0A7M5X9R9_9CNID